MFVANDWADAIVVRLDTGVEVRLALPDPTATVGIPCEGTVLETLDFGERPGRVWENEHLRGHVREEAIGIGDRVYVSGEFSHDTTTFDDPMRREGTGRASETWTVRRPGRAGPVLLYHAGFADFGPFGPRSLRCYRGALRITLPAFSLYLAVALMVFGRLW